MASSEAMMTILIAAQGQHVAPRFDLCTELVIARAKEGRLEGQVRTILLPGASADKICNIAISEGATVVVAGGMEEEHYQYLLWKKIGVLDFVLGPVGPVLDLALKGQLEQGTIVKDSGGAIKP